MKSILRRVDDHGIHYRALMFVCPGCIEMYPGSTGLHMLAVNSSEKKPSWTFNGDLEFPTLSPSILTKHGENSDGICHSFLKKGVIEYLGDCTHSLANQHVPLPDLPDWVVKEREDNE